MSFLSELQAAVEKAKPLSGKKKKKDSSNGASENVSAPKQFAALSQVVSSKMVGKLLGGFRLKSLRLSQKDISDLAVNLGPKVIAALLVDTKVVAKKDQLSLQRKLASWFASKK